MKDVIFERFVTFFARYGKTWIIRHFFCHSLFWKYEVGKIKFENRYLDYLKLLYRIPVLKFYFTNLIFPKQ